MYFIVSKSQLSRRLNSRISSPPRELTRSLQELSKLLLERCQFLKRIELGVHNKDVQQLLDVESRFKKGRW
jgi:hypothetical protein